MQWQRVLRPLVQTAVREVVRAATRATPRPKHGRAHRRGRATSTVPRRDTGQGAGYPGDFVGPLTPTYAPHPDGQPDPGEIVWTWVPYEEDHSQGKDRPVLLVGRDGPWLLALQLSSQDHDRDEDQERRAGRLWVDIGSAGAPRRRSSGPGAGRGSARRAR